MTDLERIHIILAEFRVQSQSYTTEKKLIGLIDKAKSDMLFDLDEIDNKPWRVFRQLAVLVPECAETYERYEQFYSQGGGQEVMKLIEQAELDSKERLDKAV